MHGLTRRRGGVSERRWRTWKDGGRGGVGQDAYSHSRSHRHRGPRLCKENYGDNFWSVKYRDKRRVLSGKRITANHAPDYDLSSLPVSFHSLPFSSFFSVFLHTFLIPPISPSHQSICTTSLHLITSLIILTNFFHQTHSHRRHIPYPSIFHHFPSFIVKTHT